MNSSKEITELLTEIFQGEGYSTKSIFTYEFKGNEQAFDAFINKFHPDVIVYDIAVPYDENYQLLQKLLARRAATRLPFVLTTTNKDALQKMIGESLPAHELIGKPFDIHEIIDAVGKGYSRKHQLAT